MRKAILILTAVVLLTSIANAQRKPAKPDPYGDVIRDVLSQQPRTLAIGNVELRLGMSQEIALNLLSKYRVTASGGGHSFTVQTYNSETKLYGFLGSVGFVNSQLTYISRSLDTSAWPKDEGFSVGRAIYDALSAAIERTDNDGAKRAAATIVISSDDADGGLNFRTIDLYVNNRKITILIADSPKGKSVSAQIDIRSKAW